LLLSRRRRQTGSKRDGSSDVCSSDLVTYSVGYNNAWLDVAGAGVTKASGLEALRQILHVDEADTVAIGDGFNDVEMLQWAQRGVAMGQAPREVKQIADEI